MTLLQLFDSTVHSPWNNTKDKVSWKIIDGRMKFQPTKEKIDWWRNFFIIPTLRKIRDRWFILPLGYARSWDSIKPIITQNIITGFDGYSQGAVYASLGAYFTNTEANAFGCPNFMIGNRNCFSNVKYYQNKEDIVPKVPPLYSKGENIIILDTKVERPKEVSWLAWLTGHTTYMYRKRLEEYDATTNG